MADATTKPAEGRSQRRTLVGIVTRDKMNKTRRVEVQRLVKHARYGKYVKRSTVCYAHDEANETRNGDTVEIMETRPLSKTKHWRLVRIVTKAPEVAPTVETPATTPAPSAP
jgi:small subunit ribosomal protein S17